MECRFLGSLGLCIIRLGIFVKGVEWGGDLLFSFVIVSALIPLLIPVDEQCLRRYLRSN